MLWWVVVAVLSRAPFLGTVLYVETPVGWKCSAVCHTSGNDDGGSCRSPTFAKEKPTREACRAELERQCAKAKPPPGGCRVGRENLP